VGNEDATKTATNMMGEYIHDASTDVYKVKLNGGDDHFLRDVILRSGADEIVGREPTTASEKRLREAKLFFFQHVSGKTLEELLQLISKVLNGLRFTRYQVASDAEAGLIFEVMNDRGRPLDQLDKIKNYLIYLSYKAGDQDLAVSINHAWGEILKNVMSSSKLSEDEVLRYYWVMSSGEPKQYDVHRALKTRLSRSSENVLLEVRERVTSLKEASYVVRELTDPSRGFSDWDGALVDEIREYLRGLSRLRVIATFMPLLIAGRIVFREQPKLFLDIARICETFAFRVYKVGNRRADTGVAMFSALAHGLFLKKREPPDELQSYHRMALIMIGELVTKYGDDAQVKQNLESSNVSEVLEGYEIRHLLSELEKYKCAQAAEAPVSWEDLQKATIEHIWPVWPRDREQWSRDQWSEHRQHLNLIGNLTLTFWNPELSNKDFFEKRTRYGESSLRIQRELAQKAYWSAAEIRARTEEIVRFAFSRWKIPGH